jgi:hypothetical protein
MALSPQYGWAEPDNSSLVKNGAADIRTLGDAIDTSVWNVGYGQAGKNKIINGDFRIWQRGLTFSSPTVNQYLSDRWFFGGGSNFTGTINAETFTPGTAPVAGYEGQYFWRFNGSATTPALLTRIEDVRTFAGQTVTFSFWGKANASFATGLINLKQDFGSGGSAGVNNTATGVTLTTSWARYSFTIALPSVAGKTIGTSSFLQTTINFATMSSNVVDIWGVQLEYGSKATPFQTATGTIQGELSACMRYFINYTGKVGAFASVNMPQTAASTTQSYGPIAFPVNMRVTPSITRSGTINLDVLGGVFEITAMTVIQDMETAGGTNIISVQTTVASGLTVYRTCYIRPDNNSRLQFSAEL